MPENYTSEVTMSDELIKKFMKLQESQVAYMSRYGKG